jgi:hypothetical protein
MRSAERSSVHQRPSAGNPTPGYAHKVSGWGSHSWYRVSDRRVSDHSIEAGGALRRAGTRVVSRFGVFRKQAHACVAEPVDLASSRCDPAVWEGKVLAELVHGTFTHEHRLDAVHLFLDKVVEALKHSSGVVLDTDQNPIARTHGRERQALSRSIEEVVHECGLLPEAVVERASGVGAPLEPNALVALSRGLYSRSGGRVRSQEPAGAPEAMASPIRRMIFEESLRERAPAACMLFMVSPMRSPIRHTHCLGAAARIGWIGVFAWVEPSKRPRARREYSQNSLRGG